MIMCVLLCYPLSIHMSQLLSTGRPISSLNRPLVQNFCKLVQVKHFIHLLSIYDKAKIRLSWKNTVI